MKTKTFTFRLLFLIAAAFAVIFISVLYTANLCLIRIIDQSQEKIYQEKLLAVNGVLQRRYDRLEKTGMLKEYEDDFKTSALKELTLTYANRSTAGILPFILDANGTILLDPYPDSRTGLKSWAGIVSPLMTDDRGSHVTRLPSGENHWLTYMRFPAWNWIVGFAVPFSVKYSDARAFRTTLISILAITGTLVLSLLGAVIIRFTHPISELTEAARKMASGDLTTAIAVKRNDELGILGRSFEQMRDAIQSSFMALDEKNNVLAKEILEREKTQAQLQSLRNYLENIINSMPSILVGIDPSGTITHWNLEAEKYLGIHAGEAIGTALETVLPELRSEMETVREAIATRCVQHEKKTIVKNGNRLHQEITVFPLIANGVDGAVIRVDDVTERVRMEEMMIQTEKMMSVGGLAAGMAHEINNPLGVMVQAAQNIIRRISPDLPANRRAAESAGISLTALEDYFNRRELFLFIQDIRESGERAATIVSNMLQFSRKSDSRHEPVHLSDVIDQTLFLAQNDYDLKKKYDFRQIKIIKDFLPDLPQVSLVVTEIEQVILNLIKNAAHAMALNTKDQKEPELTIRTRQQGDLAVIEISDNGPGMTEDVRKRIFEPFFTTKPVGIGTGLGLSVSYMIITSNHGGTLTVESEPGKGTTITIHLPIHAGTTEQEHP